MQSQAGTLIRIAQDLDAALESRIAIDENTVATDEFVALKMLRMERERRKEELRAREAKRQQ